MNKKMQRLHEQYGSSGHTDKNGNFVKCQGEGHKHIEKAKMMNSYKGLESLMFSAMSRTGVNQRGK